jgi:hypothetical protein
VRCTIGATCHAARHVSLLHARWRRPNSRRLGLPGADLSISAVRLRHAWPWCAVARCARRQGLEAQSLHEFVKAELPTLLDVLAPSNDAGMDDDDGSRYPHPAGPPRLFTPRSI